MPFLFKPSFSFLLSPAMSLFSMDSLSPLSMSEEAPVEMPMPEPPEEASQQHPRKPRKKRKTITQELVDSVVTQVTRPNRQSNKLIAQNVGLSYSAFMNLLNDLAAGKYDYHGDIVFIPNKKGRKPKVTKEIEAQVKEILLEKTTATLDSARERLAEEGTQLGRTTIWRTAMKLKLSKKVISLRPAVVFTQRNIDQRFTYAQRVNEMPDQELWFLDESGFNLHVAPLRCWAPVGQTPVQPVPANREQNLSLLMCIAPDGIMAYEMKDGAYRGPDFIRFIGELAGRFECVQRGDVTLVMDNARIHHAAEARDFLLESGVKHICLPPYSPDLNPIENVFGVLKRNYRAQGVARTRDEMRDRVKDVIDELNRDMDMGRFYERMRTFVDMAMNRQSFN